MIGGVHLLRVRVERAEVAQEKVASQMALQQIMIVIGDGAQMMIGGEAAHLVVNQARVDQALANRVRAVALHQMMTVLGAGVTTTIGEALLVANLARVEAAR